MARLLDLASVGQSYSNQECVCSILARSVESAEKNKQKLQESCGAVARIGDLLSSPSYKVQVAALNWLSKLTFQNDSVSRTIVRTTPGRTSPTSTALVESYRCSNKQQPQDLPNCRTQFRTFSLR